MGNESWAVQRHIDIAVNAQESISGVLSIPPVVGSVIAFAHGSGSSRFSPRNRYMARLLNDNGFATLLLDLLTAREVNLDETSGQCRFDVELLGQRMGLVLDWLAEDAETRQWNVGLFGVSTSAAAALIAAAVQPTQVASVVARSGRPDLCLNVLPAVEAPTLLIVGGNDDVVLELNRQALRQMHCWRHLQVVAGAGHLFEEAGALDAMAALTIDWFRKYLTWVDGHRRAAG